jgi:hypothetical protein
VDQGSHWPFAVREWPNSRTIKLTHNRAAQAILAPVYQRESQSPAPTNNAGTVSRHEPAVSPWTFIVPLKRPTAHAYVMGPPYDSATIKYLRFDCDATKGALWRFGEAAHLLISRCGANGRKTKLTHSDCEAINAVARH